MLSRGCLAFLGYLLLAKGVSGHFAAWHIGMYCLNGTDPTIDNQDNAFPVTPLFQLNFTDWWFHHVDKCDQFPPAEGQFLELPANGRFTVELATNRAFTTLGHNGAKIATFGDGEDHPGLGDRQSDGSSPCITEPNIHTQNETMAAGTAFAISYQSELSKVTPDNLVVFTTLYHTPWKRLATYDVPNLPACPDEGCICAWGWVANGCGEPNIYMEGFKCKVTGYTGSKPVAKPSAPVWCEDNSSNCVKGPKQMLYWQQLEGNNIEVSGNDLSGNPRSPAYNTKCGFANGAQTDIFEDTSMLQPTYIAPTSTSTPSAARSRHTMPYWTVLAILPTISCLSSFLLLFRFI